MFSLRMWERRFPFFGMSFLGRDKRLFRLIYRQNQSVGWLQLNDFCRVCSAECEIGLLMWKVRTHCVTPCFSCLVKLPPQFMQTSVRYNKFSTRCANRFLYFSVKPLQGPEIETCNTTCSYGHLKKINLSKLMIGLICTAVLIQERLEHIPSCILNGN